MLCPMCPLGLMSLYFHLWCFYAVSCLLSALRQSVMVLACPFGFDAGVQKGSGYHIPLCVMTLTSCKNTSKTCNWIIPYSTSAVMVIRITYLVSTYYKKKLHGLSPRANYTDRATTACRRSNCQFFADRGCHVVSVTDPYGSILGFLDKSRYFSIN
jgi:hypothetical protein